MAANDTSNSNTKDSDESRNKIEKDQTGNTNFDRFLYNNPNKLYGIYN